MAKPAAAGAAGPPTAATATTGLGRYRRVVERLLREKNFVMSREYLLDDKYLSSRPLSQPLIGSL